jgi:hypothetical protein
MIEKPIKADIFVRSLGGNLRDAVLNPFHIHSMPFERKKTGGTR